MSHVLFLVIAGLAISLLIPLGWRLWLHLRHLYVVNQTALAQRLEQKARREGAVVYWNLFRAVQFAAPAKVNEIHDHLGTALCLVRVGIEAQWPGSLAVIDGSNLTPELDLVPRVSVPTKLTAEQRRGIVVQAKGETLWQDGSLVNQLALATARRKYAAAALECWLKSIAQLRQLYQLTVDDLVCDCARLLRELSDLRASSDEEYLTQQDQMELEVRRLLENSVSQGSAGSARRFLAEIQREKLTLKFLLGKRDELRQQFIKKHSLSPDFF